MYISNIQHREIERERERERENEREEERENEIERARERASERASERERERERERESKRPVRAERRDTGGPRVVGAGVALRVGQAPDGAALVANVDRTACVWGLGFRV